MILGAMLALMLVVAAPALADHLAGLKIKEGSNRDEILKGTRGADGLFAKGGDDILYGRGSGDFLDADSDAANTVRGRGQDIVYGGGGADDIYGGPKGDILRGQSGNDEINDGRYNGTSPTKGDNARDIIYCGPGLDEVTAEPRDVVASDCEVVKRRP